MREDKVVFRLGADVTNVKEAIEQISKAMQNVTLPKGLTKDLESALSQLNKGITEFESKKSTAKSPLDFSKAVTAGEKVVEQFEKLKVVISSITKLDNDDFKKLIPTELLNAFDAMDDKIKDYKKDYKAFIAEKERLDKRIKENTNKREEKENAVRSARDNITKEMKGKKRGTIESRIARAQETIRAEKRVEDIKGFRGYSAYKKKISENKKAGRKEEYGLSDIEKTWSRDIKAFNELKGSKSMPKIREQLEIDKQTIARWNELDKILKNASTSLQQFNATDNTKKLQEDLGKLEQLSLIHI